ncbi:MAG: NB-ARC domain-containing protein, partial [Actinomycetota bacterium]
MGGDQPVTSLIGRDAEREELGVLVEQYPLTTLVGPGGVGKTTLAVTVAEGLSDRFDGGVHIVELSGLVDDDDVAGSVARQLGATSLDGFR